MVRSSGGSDSVDGREFRRVLGHYPTGVTVVTAATDDGPEGMTIGSFTSVSLDPPLVSFCPGHDSDSWLRMRGVGGFCVNVLSDRQAELSSTFASKMADRFEGVVTRVEATGAPVIEGCLAWIDCQVHAVHTAGDHDIVVGRVVAMGTAPDAGAAGGTGAAGETGAADARGPLVFFKGGYGRVSDL